LLKSDGLISGGGSLFQDVTSSRSVIYYSSIIGLAKMAKRPVFIYAQGLGPLNKKINKNIVKYFFNKTDYITLRDKESKELVKSIGVTKKIDIVPDPVMGFNIDSLSFDIKESYKNKDYVIISIRDWKNSNTSFLKDIATTCDKIIDNGVDVVFIPMHGEHDEKTSKKVTSIMKQKATILSKDLTMEEKMMYIKNSKLVIGMRLHALIFSATVGTPMIGISYDPKVDSYLELINQPSIGNVEVGWDPIELANKSLDIVANHDTKKKELSEYSEGLKSTAKLTVKKALKTFNK
jgi:polysaccharide pyruvyl transferase CsaB